MAKISAACSATRAFSTISFLRCGYQTPTDARRHSSLWVGIFLTMATMTAGIFLKVAGSFVAMM